jgi:hypothetical protein
MRKYIVPQIKRKGMKYLLFIVLLVAVVITAACVGGNKTTTVPLQVTSIPVTTISQLSCAALGERNAALVEGKYTTAESAKPYATFETTSGGKAIMILPTPSAKTTFNIVYSPYDANRPCDGNYKWQGSTSDGKSVSGEFSVVGKNPDKIYLYGAYGGYEDRLEMTRV